MRLPFYDHHNFLNLISNYLQATKAMERALRPDRFDILPDTPSCEKEFKFFLRTLENYLAVLPQADLDKLKVLVNHLSPTVFEYISEELTFQGAVDALKKIYMKPTNVVFGRHVLSIRKQRPEESLDKYLQELKSLAKHCDFKAVDANEHRDQYIRDAFIAGISASTIRQRILEDGTTNLADVFEKARSLSHAQKNVESFGNTDAFLNAIPSNDQLSQQQQQQQVHYQQQQLVPQLPMQPSPQQQHLQFQPPFQHPPPPHVGDPSHLNAIPRDNNNNNNNNNMNNDSRNQNRDPNQCGNCGNARHPRSSCPARGRECYVCGKKGHMGKMCRSKPKSNSMAAASVYVSQFP